jgi:hypothetical protein
MGETTPISDDLEPYAADKRLMLEGRLAMQIYNCCTLLLFLNPPAG